MSLVLAYLPETTIEPVEICEAVQSLGQEWLRVPDALEWGLEDMLIVQTTQGQRLVLCRVEKFTRYESNKPVVGGIRKLPIKLGEIEVLSNQGERP